jgi:type I restriction enzyme R subunit
MSHGGKHTELRFELAIERALLRPAGGYIKRDPRSFDAVRGLFPDDVVAYVKTSQPKKWQSLVDLQGEAAKTVLLDALEKELAAKGKGAPLLCPRFNGSQCVLSQSILVVMNTRSGSTAK